MERALHCHAREMKKFASLVFVALVACSGESTATDADALAATTRADTATNALVTRFWDSGQSTLRGEDPSNGSLAGYWIYAQAFDAVLDAVQRGGESKFRTWMDTLYRAQDARGWQRDYFDDENWMALALIRAYDVTRDAKYLSRAESLFADIEQNGRTNSGVWWNRAHTQKATASNFGPAITAARLNERTGNASYQTAAIQIYDYWYSTMVNRTTSQVADHRNADGSVDWSKFTYDTGLAIGASIELWKITNNAGYLNHAYAFGDYLIHEQVGPSTYGNVLSDGPHCTGDCDAFKGIAFRFLMKLYGLDEKQTQYGAVLKASVRAIWYEARNDSTNVFASSWTGGAPKNTSLAADASAVMALNLAAENGL
jgi:predicted alpha-1,6-mannanase (GH76 family)